MKYDWKGQPCTVNVLDLFAKVDFAVYPADHPGADQIFGKRLLNLHALPDSMLFFIALLVCRQHEQHGAGLVLLVQPDNMPKSGCRNGIRAASAPAWNGKPYWLISGGAEETASWLFRQIEHSKCLAVWRRSGRPDEQGELVDSIAH